MKKIVIVLICACCCGCAFASSIAWDDISAGNTRLRTVLVDSLNPRLAFIGSDKGVFKTEDAGLNWRNILSIRGQNKAVNFLLSDPQNRNFLYAATGNGLYFSADQGKNWRRIFQGKNYFERESTVLAILPAAIYLGTKSGLFISQDKGRTWHKQGGRIGKSHILAIANNPAEPNYIYAACVDGVFISGDAGQNWERIFVASATDKEEEGAESSEDEDEGERSSDIRYISADPNKTNYLYLATNRGVYASRDRGKTWETLPDYGLLSKDVRFLLVSAKSELYAVSKSGIFRFTGQRWEELSFGLSAEEINFIALDSRDNLYAASDKGLCKASLEYFSRDNQADIITMYSKDEPEIAKVQQVAIRYAEVEPEKIMRWRKQAAKRAWLPKVTIDMDRDIDRTVSSSIWGIYGNGTTPGRYFVGPDDETRYNNNNWGVSLTWELGDLIWSGDQTSIDVRSRLMVELRDDVLDEVTKTYFERLRVKMELDNLSIEDRKKRYEKELRLEELTASLDSLTGGYFSKAIKNKKEG